MLKCEGKSQKLRAKLKRVVTWREAIKGKEGLLVPFLPLPGLSLTKTLFGVQHFDAYYHSIIL